MRTEGFEKRYQAGDTPWDTGRPDFNLIHTITSMSIQPCKALDIGCGTGNNSLWLAQNDFDVIGIDTSEIATQKAAGKAAGTKGQSTFMVVDFLTQNIGTLFGFAFDRGCFHTLSSSEERKNFAENVAAHLEKDGLWLSILGNADEVRHHPGPPQRTAGDIVNSVEPYFEILSLISSQFESNRPNPPRAWVCLMRKRNNS